MTQLCAGDLQCRNEAMNVFLSHFSRDSCFLHGSSLTASIPPPWTRAMLSPWGWVGEAGVCRSHVRARVLVHMDVPASAQADLFFSQSKRRKYDLESTTMGSAGQVCPCSEGTITKAHSPAWLLQLELLSMRRLAGGSGHCLSHITFAFSPLELCFWQLSAAGGHCSLYVNKAAAQKCLVKAFLFSSPMKNDF